MSRTFQIHMRRTWEERFAFTVEATSVEEALLKANLEHEEVGFDWDNVEEAGREVIFVDDADGREVYALQTDDVQPVSGSPR